MKINELQSIFLDPGFSNYHCNSIFLENNKIVLFGTFVNNLFFEYTNIQLIYFLEKKIIYNYKIIDQEILTRDFAISSNGKYIAYNDYSLNKTILFETETKKFFELPKENFGSQFQKDPFIISSDKGNYFIFTNNINNEVDGFISIFEIKTQIFKKKIKFPSELRINDVSFGIEQFIESYNQIVFINPFNYNIQFYNIDLEKTEKTIINPYFENFKLMFISVAISNNYKYLAGLGDVVNDEVPSIIIWNLETGKMVQEIHEDPYERPETRVNLGEGKIYFSPSSKYLFLQTLNQLVIYDLESGKKLKKTEPAFCSSISQNGKYLGFTDGKTYKIFEFE
jgi:WD40 repeat protein